MIEIETHWGDFCLRKAVRVSRFVDMKNEPNQLFVLHSQPAKKLGQLFSSMWK